MRKIYILPLLLLLCCLTAGCGRKEASAGYYDILSERQDFYDVSANIDVRGNFLGMQFYQDEPVQLWALADPLDREKADIYLYTTNGEKKRIMKGLRDDFLSGSYSGFLDRDGNLYCFSQFNHSFVVIKTNPDGKQLYRHEEDKDFILADICQLADGRIFLACQGTGSGMTTYMPAELNPDTGSISDSTTFAYDASLYMGTGDSGLLCLNSQNIYRIDADNGMRESIWTFCGTTYVFPESSSSQTLTLWDFRMDENGCPELLWGERKGSGSFVETLQKTEADASKEIIVARGLYFDNWLLKMTSLFNQENDDYYVALETCGSEGDMDDYTMTASIEVAAGKGPDIFVGDLLGEYAYGIAQKGGFVNLTPYLESSGIDENDYFPATFAKWRQDTEIYSILPSIALTSYYMNGDILDRNLNPDIDALVDVLLSWQGNAVYMIFPGSTDGIDSLSVLEMLLQGSEDIWGAVDWESGTCDFGGSLFARILKTAKRYGGDSVHNYPGLLQQEYYNLYLYKDKNILEKEGLAAAGILFDDGCYPQINPYYTYTLLVNINSAHKDGAWEFIQFLLGYEAQAAQGLLGTYPSNKNVFDVLIAKEQAEGYGATTSYPEYFEQSGHHYLTDERVEYLKETLENTRFLPTKTDPILSIIYEEAQAYFAGLKDINEVTVLIENRVQLYLDENR